jgi:Xaa-Pro aminopeptidase
MSELTAAKLRQAAGLVAASGADLWLVFVRETAEGGDPILPLILEGGLTWQSALIVAASGRRVAVVGNYDADPLRASGDWDEVVPYVQGIRADLVRALDRLVPELPHQPRIAIDFSVDDPKADGLSHGMYLLLQDILEGTRFEGCCVSAAAIANGLRGRKSPEELRRLRRAVRETEEIFRELGAQAAIGHSEREIFAFAQERILARGLGFSWERHGDPIVNTGPDSMVGHGLPSATIRVATGHILHLDLGVLFEGYASDLQRSWFVREPHQAGLPQGVEQAFAVVHGAISEGARALRPGIEGWRVDEAARNFIVAAGRPEYQHALGHQVGRMAHDGGAVLAPRWERYGRSPYLPVELDQVYTLELGVMVEGRGYLGLEEMVLVTADGCAWLSERQDALAVIG